MNPFDASTDDGLLEFIDRTGKDVQPLGPPGLFHNFGEGLGGSIMAGLARTGRAAAMAVAPAAIAVDEVSEAAGTVGDFLRTRSPYAPTPIPAERLETDAQDWYFDNVVGATNQSVDFWTPDAANVGMAGQTLNGLAQSLVPLAAGGVVPLAGTVLGDTPTELVNQGVDADTALGVGAVYTVATAAGFRLPAAFGSTLVQRLATGAGGNLALGESSRQAAGALLTAAGETDLAGIHRDNPTATAIDLGMGLVFGGLAHATAPRITPAHRDAMLTANNAHHFQEGTMPGAAVDNSSAVLHQNALVAAVGQVLNGEPVDLSKVLNDAVASFVPSGPLREAVAGRTVAAANDGGAPAAFESVVEGVLRSEGGFVNDPVDRGGATNFGISSKAHPGVDVATITRDQAIAIYRREYWDAIGADQLPADVRGVAFDAAVNQGVGWTKRALDEAGGDPAAFLQLREARYREIVANDPSQAKFLRGWLNRMNRFKETSEAGVALRERLVSDPEQLTRDYAALEDSKGGTVLNTDTARELSTDYLADRTRSADVHEAASDTIKTIYETKLAQPTPEGFDRAVLFTAGGTGAGKTTAIRDAGEAFGKPEIVYDTNMNTLASAVDKVEQALAAGREVDIAYVYRDPVEALTGGAIPRAQRQAEKFGSGRTVPLEEHARTHEGVRPVMEALAERYAGDDRVRIRAIDNSHGKGNAKLVALESLPRVEQTQLRENLQTALDEARTGGLAEDLYRGFSAEGRAGDPGRSGNPPRPGDGGRPEQGHRGEVAARTAAHEAAVDPGLLIADADGTVRPASEFLKDAETLAQQQADLEGRALAAAVNCFLRSGT